MKLSGSQINGFLDRPPSSVRVFLFYGPDSGLAHERAEALAQKLKGEINDPFALVALSGAAVGGDESILRGEAASMSLGGGRRMIRVHQAAESNASAVKRFLDKPPPNDSVILIAAGDLEKRSKLRALCEGETPLAAAIPCYIEDAAARARSVGAFLQKEGLKAPRDVVSFLVDVLPPDRMAMRSELDKLALYAQGGGELSLTDVRAVIADAGGAEIDDLVQAVANGEALKATALLDHLFEEQTSPVAILRGMQRHLMRLQLARSFMDGGASASEAIKKLSPPVFWKNVDPMIRQLGRWSAARIELRLAQLLDAEAAVKRTGTPDVALVSQLLLGMAGKG